MEEITMSLRVAVPLFCLVVWIVILACSEGIMPTDASEAGFKSDSRAAVGFNGNASGFPAGAVRLTGGGSYEPASAPNTVPTTVSHH
jgi:hypothetical protein